MVEISSSTIPTRTGLAVMVYSPLSLPFMGASLVPSGVLPKKRNGGGSDCEVLRCSGNKKPGEPGLFIPGGG